MREEEEQGQTSPLKCDHINYASASSILSSVALLAYGLLPPCREVDGGGESAPLPFSEALLDVEGAT